MIEPIGHERYWFIKKEEEQALPPKQEPKHEVFLPVQGNNDQV